MFKNPRCVRISFQINQVFLKKYNEMNEKYKITSLINEYKRLEY